MFEKSIYSSMPIALALVQLKIIGILGVTSAELPFSVYVDHKLKRPPSLAELTVPAKHTQYR